MDAVSCVREKISLDDLIHLRKCRKSLEFNELSLNYKGYEAAKIIRKALGSLKEMKEITKETAFRKVDEIFRNEYLKEWFDFQYQYEQALERDLIRVKRIIEYICKNEYGLLEADVPFSIQIGATYRGYKITCITGVVDFVFGKGNDVIFVNIRSGENPYSYRARRVDTIVENSIELLATAVGVGSKYQDKKVYIESWYIKNKDDKTYSLVPDYEDKRGKNIASIMVENLSVVKDRFYYVAAFPEDGPNKCKECIHNSVCRASFEARKDVPDTEEKVNKKSAAEAKFTGSQKAVIEHMEGSMCVIAGPGAGKTFTLVNRLANMLRKGITPDSILFVTFTNKAASEIKERVMSLIGTTNEKEIPNIYTYNALGYTILKDNPMFLGKRVRLADKVDRYTVIGEALKNSPKIVNVSYDGIYSEFGLIRSLEKWFGQIDEKGKEQFIKDECEKKDVEGIIHVYDLYTKIFKDMGYIDYDMQISLVNDLFAKYPSLASSYAKKFNYIMVDEYQDTSEDQATMIYSIAKKHGNIVVVGDDDQSIYGWRGGSNKYMMNFGHDFPTAKIIVMNDNFRSTNKILDSANVVIANNGNRYEKEIQGHIEDSYKPIYFKNGTAEGVTGLITEILKKGYHLGDIAVLARNHKRLTEVIGALEGNYKVTVPKEFIHEDVVFQTIYDVLTLYYKGLDEDESFYRFLKITGVDKLQKKVKKDSLYKNLVMSDHLLTIDKMDINCLTSYEKVKDESTLMAAGHKLIWCLKKIQYGKGVAVLNDLLLEIFGMSEHKVVDNLIEIADERAFVTISELYAYMSNMKLYHDDKTVEYEPRRDAINLLTSHSAKGKEFPVVIVYGTEDFNSNEEEIRLFYVSITRAKNTLFFIETVCNECELFPKLQGSVLVK
jgi:superfamily I DNA/RNA helicase